MTKSPREFRNALYQHIVDSGITVEAATTIATEAEVYADMFEAYKLRGIESAVSQVGFDDRLFEDNYLTKSTDDISLCRSCYCMSHTIDGKCGKCKEVKDEA